MDRAAAVRGGSPASTTYPAGMLNEVVGPWKAPERVQDHARWGRRRLAWRVGDRVWFGTPGGELCEHVDSLHLVDGDETTAVDSYYRGESKAFL